jgi:hypothetical protein
MALPLPLWKFSDKMLFCRPCGKACLHQMYVAAFVCIFKLMHSQGPVWSPDIAPIPQNYCKLHIYAMCKARFNSYEQHYTPQLHFSLALDFVTNNGVGTTHFSILGPRKQCTLLISSTSWTPLCMSHSFNLAWGFLPHLLFYIARKPNMAIYTYQHTAHPLLNKCSRNNTAILVTLSLKLFVVLSLPANHPHRNCTGQDKIKVFTPHYWSRPSCTFLNKNLSMQSFLTFHSV